MEKLQQSRIILVYKKGNRRDPNNWRPISIPSAVQRLFHRVHAARLNALCPLHGSQRGFQPINGTMANILSFESFVKGCMRVSKSHAAVSIDLSKAFDTVYHNSVERVLHRMAIDSDTID